MPDTRNAKDFFPQICRFYDPKDLAIDVLIWVNIVEYIHKEKRNRKCLHVQEALAASIQ